MDSREKPVKDDRHVPNAVKRTRITWRKIAWKKLDVQTADKIIRLTQDITYKKEKEIREVKHKRNVSFQETRKIVGTYIGENGYSSVSWRLDTTNEDHRYRTLVEKLIQLEANDCSKFQEHLKNLHSAEFLQAPAQRRVGNGERSNVVFQTKTYVGSTTPTRTTSKSAEFPTKQPLHKLPIRSPKSIKDRLKNLFPVKPEQLKPKSQAPLSQAGKIQINSKVNKERPGSTFKMPSRIKSPIRIKQCNSQGSTKTLKRTYKIESINRIVASLNLEEIINNYNTWNIIQIVLCKQMTDVKLLLGLFGFMAYQPL